MSVARAQREIDSAEFAEWLAREQLPGIHSREQRLAGIVAAVVANANRDTRRHPKPFTPDDFFTPAEPAARRDLTDDDLLAMAVAFAARANAGLQH